MLKRSMSSFSFANKNAHQISSRMSLASITELKRGVQTDLMKKVGLVDPECCLSLCNAERTLDLTFESLEYRNYFIRSMQALVFPQDIFVS
jgi:hypothetical protein